MTDQARDLASACEWLDSHGERFSMALELDPIPPRWWRGRSTHYPTLSATIIATARALGWSPPPPVTPVAETVARLRELLARATQGPLDIERRDDDGGGIDYVVYGPEGDFAICFDTDRGGAAKASAEWLVLAHTEMPALLDAIPLAKVWTRSEVLAFGERVSVDMRNKCTREGEVSYDDYGSSFCQCAHVEHEEADLAALLECATDKPPRDA